MERISILLITCLLLLFIYVIKLLWSRRKLYALSMKLKGPFAFPLLGNAIDLGIFTDYREIVNRMYDLEKKYGGLMRLWLGPELTIIFTEAEDIECILLTKQALNKGPMYDTLADDFGKGLVTASGNIWKKHRHIINPSFGGIACKSYQPIHDEHARYMVNSLLKLKNTGPVEVSIFCLRIVTDVITGALFRVNAEFYKGGNDEILKCLPRGASLIYEKVVKPWYGTGSFIYKYTKSGKNLKYCRDSIYNFYEPKVTKIVDEYLTEKSLISGDVQKDMTKSSIQLMADSLDAGNFTLQEIFDEFGNIYLAGTDTCYTHLSFFLLMMGMHKRCQDLVWQEIKETFADDIDAPVTSEVLSKMPYLAMCMKEVTRLFPTGTILSRKLENDFHMKHRDLIIPAGTQMIMCNYILHRNPKYWDNPDLYIPERFSPEASANRPNFAYLPFSAGARNCIASAFGHDLLKTASIHLLRNMEFHSDLKIKDLRLIVDISTRSAQGYHLSISERNKNI